MASVNYNVHVLMVLGSSSPTTLPEIFDAMVGEEDWGCIYWDLRSEWIFEDEDSEDELEQAFQRELRRLVWRDLDCWEDKVGWALTDHTFYPVDDGMMGMCPF